MSFSFQEREKRRRRRTWSRIFQIVAFFALPLATLLIGYGIGQELDVRRVSILKDENDALQLELGRLQRERAGMIQQVTAAQAAAQEWQNRYERDIPEGQRAALMALIDRTLALGVTPERIGRFVEAAAEQRDCGSPSTKRFLIGTDVNPRQAQSVSFVDGQVSVSGQGTAARNDSGLPQGWFDPAQSVSLEFTLIGGQRVESSGVLPINTSVLMGADEVRFAVAVSDVRGYVDATAVLCQ